MVLGIRAALMDIWLVVCGCGSIENRILLTICLPTKKPPDRSVGRGALNASGVPILQRVDGCEVRETGLAGRGRSTWVAGLRGSVAGAGLRFVVAEITIPESVASPGGAVAV